MEVRLNLQGLTNPQKKLFNSTKRFLIACWGRQSGKTTAGLYLMLTRALAGRSGGVYWYVLQTHTAAEVAFNRFWDIVRGTEVLAEKPNESEKFCTLINGAKIFFKSGENYEDLRAETLDGVIVDEFRQQHPGLWTKVLRPMLARFKAWAVVLSTPNGYEHFYELFENAKKDPEWEAFPAPSTEAWWWTPEEIESARRTMTDDEFAQEILAEFREFGVGKVYKNHSIENQRTQNPFGIQGQKWSPYLPIVVGMDFNVGLMAWELAQFRGQDCYFGDELALKESGTAEAAHILVSKVGGHPAGVELIGDASGNARRSVGAVGATDYSITLQVLKEAGIKVVNRTPESNPPVKDRVNMFNIALRDATGVRHFFYNPITNLYLKRDLERVTWKQGTDNAIFDKKDPLLTHASDAAGYPVSHYSTALRQKPGRMHVLIR